MRNPQTLRRITLVILMAMASLACAVTGILPTKEAVTPPEVPPDATIPPPETPQPEGPGFLQLDKLESYRSVLKLTLKGQTQNGETVQRNFEMINEVIRSQEASHISLMGDAINPAGESKPVELFVLGDKTYVYTPLSSAKPCFLLSTISGNYANTPFEKPSDLFSVLVPGNLIAENENIDGIATDHYEVSQSKIEFGEITSQKSEVWVAREGDYPVRFAGQAEGVFSLSIEKVSGIAEWEFNLSSVNQLAGIDLPPVCLEEEKASADIPILPDAEDKTTYGGTISYNSATAPAAAADFYHTQLAANGWKIYEEASTPPVFILSARKGERKMQVNIGPDLASGSTILIIPEL